jgi:hypothetical protein
MLDTMELAKTEDGEESFVDAPLLLGAHVADQIAESAGVDRPDLFDEHPGCLAQQIDLWAEGGSTGTRGCGRHEHHRPREELVGLDDYSVTATMLLMTSTAGRTKLVDITPEHACSP